MGISYNKDKLAQWFYAGEANLTQNQDYALIQKDEDGTVKKMCWGKVLEMSKPTRLVYTFTIAPLAGEMTTVTWALEEVHGGTKLSLTHSGISKAAGDAAMGLLTALDAGWDRHIGGLRKALA
ncbi:MAG: SRPBCC domain-containing protein [Rhizobiaceae bacterium]|nr:SRPBCC domain-containing protein [Rhizobiaceae bacterium]